VLDVLYYPVSAVMWFWYRAFSLVLGPASGVVWGLSVVLLVLTLRALMIKPFLAQVRAGHRMQAIAPQLAELREHHAGDKQKLLEETQKLQREHGVNPLGGCLPLLIQLPVFLALLHVLRYFNRPGLSFEQNAAIPNYVFGPDQVRSFLQARLFGAPLSSYITMPQSLLDSFGTHVDRWEVVAVAVPLLLLAAVATHITARFSLRQQQVGQVALEAGSQAAQVAAFMRWTPWIFPLGAIVGGLFFPFPIAILLYWLTNSAWTMAQQHLVHRAMATEAAQITAQAPARAETAPRPGQKPTLPPGATPLAASASGAPVAGADHECSDPGTPQPGAAQRGRKATASRKRAGARKGGRHGQSHSNLGNAGPRRRHGG
jgi:YidC/Oxa1 family membrane protein insertase